jgi:hypothetical protein
MMTLPAPLPLALPAPAWHTAPRDRAIWIHANLIYRSDSFTEVEPFEGRAQWNEAAQDWLDSRKMSIRGDVETSLRILQWSELKTEAQSALREGRTQEFDLRANIYFWDDEYRREMGTAGHFVFVEISHAPTYITVIDLSAHALASFSEAVKVLRLLTDEATRALEAGLELGRVIA